MKINNFAIIIGAMKCGTTSLYQYLIEHPQIAPCRKKETGFFNRDYDKGIDYYQSLWDYDPKIHKIALEGTPGYSRCTKYFVNHLNPAENIAKFQADTNARIKFIYIMRNPIETIESIYTAGRSGRWSNCDIYNDMSKLIAGDKNTNIDIVDTVRYAMQIEEYYKRFPYENILLLQFEDLKNDRETLLKKICQFLEIDSEYKFQNINQIHNSHSSKTKVFVPGYSMIRNTNIVRRLIRFIPDKVRQEKIGKFRKFFARQIDVEVKYFKLTPEERNYVLRELQGDLVKLTLKHGVDISRWGITV